MKSELKKSGRFGPFGGQYVSETLMPALLNLENAWQEACADRQFTGEYEQALRQYAGRPSLLYYAERVSNDIGRKVYLKREDLNHTGSHKINNVLGQALLARRMGKKKLIAETGAGQHGVAAATVAAWLDMECQVFMGAEDMDRQELNVFRMEMLGAQVNKVSCGNATLQAATSEAMREWSRTSEDTFYVIGSCMGPHPYPAMVRDFQKIIGTEIRAQMAGLENRLPDVLLACVGGGSNAIGTFYPFLADASVSMYAAEAGGKGINTDEHAATANRGWEGIFHGMRSYFLQDADGQIAPVYSLSPGLDYPGIGPEHAWLLKQGRVSYHPVDDQEAVDALIWLSRLEGIVPAIESAHAVALLRRLAPALPEDNIVVVTLSGRGDKDVASIKKYLHEQKLIGESEAGINESPV